MERKWLEGAGIKLPKQFSSPEKIDCPVIIKFFGAGGGKGYFLAKDEQDFNEKIKKFPDKNMSFKSM